MMPSPSDCAVVLCIASLLGLTSCADPATRCGRLRVPPRVFALGDRVVVVNAPADCDLDDAQRYTVSERGRDGWTSSRFVARGLWFERPDFVRTTDGTEILVHHGGWSDLIFRRQSSGEWFESVPTWAAGTHPTILVESAWLADANRARLLVRDGMESESIFEVRADGIREDTPLVSPMVGGLFSFTGDSSGEMVVPDPTCQWNHLRTECSIDGCRWGDTGIVSAADECWGALPAELIRLQGGRTALVHPRTIWDRRHAVADVEGTALDVAAANDFAASARPAGGFVVVTSEAAGAVTLHAFDGSLVRTDRTLDLNDAWADELAVAVADDPTAGEVAWVALAQGNGVRVARVPLGGGAATYEHLDP